VPYIARESEAHDDGNRFECLQSQQVAVFTLCLKVLNSSADKVIPGEAKSQFTISQLCWLQ